jgi:esterase
MGTQHPGMTLPPETPLVALYHRNLGGAGDPPIVILHGMLGSSRNWQTAGRELASGRRVLAVDLRNHGHSPHADGMTYGEMRADVLAWMAAQGIVRADFVGHSMGGKVAMLLACGHPEKVSRLVVVDMAPKGYNWPQHRLEFAAMNALNLETLRSRAEAEAQFEPQVPGWAMRKFLATNLERRPEGGWRWQINLPAITRALPDLERNPLVPEDRYTGPALFIIGGKSSYVRPEDRETILRHFPAARFEVLPESGHNPHIEARDAFVRAVAAAERS